MSRPLSRIFCTFLLVCAAVAAAENGSTPFDFNALQARAKALAAQPYAPPQGEVPEWMRRLTYDDLRQIEFNGRESLWHRDELGFQAQFFHPGFLYDRLVHVAEVRRGRATPLPFRPEYFNYRGLKPGPMPATMGFAGLRLMYPFGGADRPPAEIGSFLGASYFRFLAAKSAYGLSARGLALDTAEPTPEEFPVFTEFWLERPEARAAELTVYALLESASVTGAYRFRIAPGGATVVTVKVVIFRRRDVRVFGLAPLTSMFWRGENFAGTVEDYRPEVHDSDGLLMHNGRGEWLWRPLDNPRRVRVAAFADENPRGFGLMQRDRNFENYQDLEATYHARPSAWVEPVGAWGRGTVRLAELPTKDEFNDNIVAFWVPEKLPPAGQPVEIEYRLHWVLEGIAPPAGYVRSTRLGKSAFYEPGLERFVVDFDGSKLQALDASAKVEQDVWVGSGAKLHHATLQKNPLNGSWRVAFTIRPDGQGKPVELRCFLRRGRDVVTETWTYLWQP
jgi:glucans biosynthesis protein